MRVLPRAIGALAIILAAGGCMPVGRDFARPTDATIRPGETSIGDVKKALGEPRTERAWSRNQGVLAGGPNDPPPPTPFTAARVGGTITQLFYYYSWRLGESATPGVDPTRSLNLWFWNDKLVAFRGTSSFRNDGTNFDETRVATIEAWKSLQADVIERFGEPSGVAVYPATAQEDQRVLIYQDFEWDTAKQQIRSKSLFVLVNALGVVEDVKFDGSSRPMPPPVPAGGTTPIQIYTPPRTPSRGR